MLRFKIHTISPKDRLKLKVDLSMILRLNINKLKSKLEKKTKFLKKRKSTEYKKSNSKHKSKFWQVYIFLLYWPPISYNAWVICPREQYLTVSISSSKVL